MAKVNWRRIADGLAERLMYQTGRCRHDPPEEDCPYCADDAAYQRYVEAGGTMRIDSFNNAVRVRIEDVPLTQEPTTSARHATPVSDPAQGQ